MNTSLNSFLNSQLRVWVEARNRFDMLRDVQTREVEINHRRVRLQYNPGRLLSSKADIKKILAGGRPCFLCAKNRPEVQTSLPFTADFEVLVNPYPILPEHYTIAATRHQPQRILAPLPDAGNALAAMLRFAETYPHLTVIYNGPTAGASAPDHLHLQAGIGDTLPLIQRWKELQPRLEPIASWHQQPNPTFSTVRCQRTISPTPKGNAHLFRLRGHCSNGFVITYTDRDAALRLFQSLCRAMQVTLHTDAEPSMNLVAWVHDGQPWLAIFPRKAHRPQCFYAEGDGRRLISPGALDMAGQITVPREDDYNRLTIAEVRQIYRDVCVGVRDLRRVITALHQQLRPMIRVGITQEKKLTVVMNRSYMHEHMCHIGQQEFRFVDGKVEWKGKTYDSLIFTPAHPAATFTLGKVMIGKQFHWQRFMRQTFEGSIVLTPLPDGTIELVNRLPLECYLTSVIASEMSADAPLELLKAHAVISRSWAMRVLQRPTPAHHHPSPNTQHPTSTPHIRWYDSEGHANYDVCADDHCQRYQGVARATNPRVRRAIEETHGQVLTFDGEICDTRYSKCCGGHTEDYSTAWEDKSIPYLTGVPDTDSQGRIFCNVADTGILKSMLNDFDRETSDFFRWTETIPQDVLRQRITDRLGTDLGDILALEPLQRGTGGHIAMLRVVGTKGETTVGKELEIRRLLSDTHLKSSNFTVEYIYAEAPTNHQNPSPTTQHPTTTQHPSPNTFVLHGKGWGHGVGLCQIGAAMMARKGYSYHEILTHYYKGTHINTIYQ